jgi:hypothetical protein
MAKEHNLYKDAVTGEMYKRCERCRKILAITNFGRSKRSSGHILRCHACVELYYQAVTQEPYVEVTAAYYAKLNQYRKEHRYIDLWDGPEEFANNIAYLDDVRKIDQWFYAQKTKIKKQMDRAEPVPANLIPVK